MACWRQAAANDCGLIADDFVPLTQSANGRLATDSFRGRLDLSLILSRLLRPNPYRIKAGTMGPCAPFHFLVPEHPAHNYFQ